jgi:hypothetical protein
MANPHDYAKDSAIFSQAVEELRLERVELSPANIEERYNKIAKGKDVPTKNGDLEPEREAKIAEGKKVSKKVKK